MITEQIVISKNSVRYLFCSKKDYKNENMIRNNKISFENLVLTMFYQKLLAIRTYTKKTLLKHNQGCEVKLKQTNLATTLQLQ